MDSEIDWEHEELMVSVGGGRQQTLDDIMSGKPVTNTKKRLLGFGHEKNNMVTMKFGDGVYEVIPKREFIEIEKQWNELQNYQRNKLREMQKKI